MSPMDPDLRQTTFSLRVQAAETDVGNKDRLCLEHADRLRYVPGLGWHVWDGQRWAADDDGGAVRLAEEVVRTITQEATHLADNTPDPETAKKKADARWKWGMRSQAQRAIVAMLKQAESDARLVVRAQALDADPYLLNVLNGTIDLRTGEIGPHDPAHLITRLAPATHNPNARSDRFDRFLADATCGDTELAEYLQRAAGYTLTGDTREEALIFLHGPSASGKTTLTEALRAVMGDYARTAPFATLLVKRERGASEDLARLAGARLVSCSEVGRDATFNAATVKALTGGDTITARHLYQAAFEFRPTFKLWLAANDRPKVEHDDGAMWRRLHVVPFLAQPSPDSKLKHALTTNPDDRSAILAWAVRGAQTWLKHGLEQPAAVQQYSAGYRTESHPLSAWLEECATLDADARTARRAVTGSYRTWCQENGEKAVSAHRLAPMLGDLGVADGGKSNGSRYWQGIGLYVTDPGHKGTKGSNNAQSLIARAQGRVCESSAPSAPSAPNGAREPRRDGAVATGSGTSTEHRTAR